MGRTIAALAAATALVGMAAGCGSDDGGSGGSDKDIEEMKAVLVKSLTVNDPEVECVETVTTNFVKTIYKSVEACKKEEAKPEDEPATGAALADVKVDGDNASAVATVQGGDTAGASGTLTFAKEDGKWKVDSLKVDFLRSTLDKGFENETDFSELGGEKAATCLRGKLQALSDSELTAMAYDAIGGRDINKTFEKLYLECATEAGSAPTSTTTTEGSTSAGDDSKLSLIRTKFEEGIRESALKDGKSGAVVDCVIEKLRTSITDDDIVAQIGKAKGDLDPNVTKATASAIIDCDK